MVSVYIYPYTTSKVWLLTPIQTCFCLHLPIYNQQGMAAYTNTNMFLFTSTHIQPARYGCLHQYKHVSVYIYPYTTSKVWLLTPIQTCFCLHLPIYNQQGMAAYTNTNMFVFHHMSNLFVFHESRVVLYNGRHAKIFVPCMLLLNILIIITNKSFISRW